MRVPDLRRHIGPPVILAVVTLVLIVVRAMQTVDPYWDTLAYHWPFAARAAGICDRDCFLLPLGMEARYAGFPMLLHTVQGYLWRLTGSPGMADLINVGMLMALGTYLKCRFAVPLAWSWLAFLAIPEAQIQLTSSYIDVPVNAAVTLALMVVLRMLVEPKADQRADIVIALAALGVAAGSKFQMVPIALGVWFAIVVLGTRNPASIGLERRHVAFAALGLAGVAALLPKVAMNALAFGNPFHPIAASFGPFHFAGPESMLQANSVSDAWAAWPRPVRWLASVLEFDAFRGRPLPWTLGQGDVPQSNPSFRMGGYFAPYVLGAVTLIGWSARSTLAARWAAAMVIVLSFICAGMPSSHELRYYMFWMLALVSCTLAVVYSPAFAGPNQLTQRGFAHGLIAIAATSVILMTGGAYLRTGGPALSDLLRETEATVARIPDGATLCIRDKDRRAFLYSSLFHVSRHYRTHLLAGDEQDRECTVRLTLDP